MKTILIAGSKTFQCSAEAERQLAEKLGAAVVKEPGWRLLTGGAIGAGCGIGKGGVDYHAAIGAQQSIGNTSIEREKIITLHPRNGRDDLFEIGSVMRSRAKSTSARRFELVSRSDCIVAIEGHEGTSQIVEYSIASGKPVIPLACTGGESAKVWEHGSYRKELLQILGIKESSPQMVLIERGLGTPDALVDICLQIMRQLLQSACFVAMPFNLPHSNALWDDMLKPVIESVGMMPVRADLVHNVGQILEDITNCITEAAIVIVDITGTNPNVMYELGYAHALNKPTILICNTNQNESWARELPFDIRGMRVIPINPWDKKPFVEDLNSVLRKLRIP